MPVRFHCPECRSKLSIARRKSGTAVACPTCRAAVVVPAADEPDAQKTELMAGRSANGVNRPPPTPAPPPDETDLDDLPLFERQDFARLLEPPSRDARVADAAPPKPVDPPPPPSANGILILRSTATVLVAAVVVLLGLAFAAGFLVGSR